MREKKVGTDGFFSPTRRERLLIQNAWTTVLCVDENINYQVKTKYSCVNNNTV